MIRKIPLSEADDMAMTFHRTKYGIFLRFFCLVWLVALNGCNSFPAAHRRKQVSATRIHGRNDFNPLLKPQPMLPLFSSRQSPDPYPEEDEYGDDDMYYYEPDKSEPQQQSKRPVKGAKSVRFAKVEQKPPNMDFRTPSRDPIERYDNSPPKRTASNGRLADNYEEDIYADEYYEDEEYDEDVAGNFWSNPLGKFDYPKSTSPPKRVPGVSDPPRVRRTSAPYPKKRLTSKRRRSTFNSGTSSAPPVLRDFYSQLFWYGFDPEETTSPADKTVFGGTKGKFNGLALLGSTMNGDRNSNNGRRRKSVEDKYDDDEYDYDRYYDDNNGFREDTSALDRRRRRRPSFNSDDDEDIPLTKPRRRVRNNFNEIDNLNLVNEDTPGRADESRNRASPPETDSRRRRRRRSRTRPWDDVDEDDSDDDDYEQRDMNYGNDWVSSTVSDWFRGDEYDDGRREENSGRPSRRQRGRQQTSPLDAVGRMFFGLNRKEFGLDNKELERRAEMYNRQMGIGSPKPRNGRNAGPRSRTGRGYAYRYDVDMSEYDSIVDADIVVDNESPPLQSNGATDAIDAQVEATDSTTNTSPKAQKQKDEELPGKKGRTWEERALAMDRIPPVGVQAWGPSGDLGMDAREKATIDAIHDIQEAKSRLELKKKRELQAMDDITILKVDLGLKQKRLASNKNEARILREDIRNLELDIEDAARSLRKSRSQVQTAQDRLSELEDRHWAVLSLYDPAQARQGVTQALRELEEREPAARIQKREKESNNSGSSKDSDSLSAS